jgi:hypothetical protein
MIRTRNFIEISTPEVVLGERPETTVMRLICNRCNGEGTVHNWLPIATPEADCEIKECANCHGIGYMDAVVTVSFVPVRCEAKESKI